MSCRLLQVLADGQHGGGGVDIAHRQAALDVLGIPEAIISVINYTIAAPVNFLLIKYWSFGKGRSDVLQSQRARYYCDR